MNIAGPAFTLCAALFVVAAAPARAQEEPPVSRVQTTSEIVTIPFAPPIGTPLAYRLRFERKRASGDSVIEFDQRLTFATIEGGYTLTVETLSFSSEGRQIDLSDKWMLDAVPAALRIYFLPKVVELDANGQMVRIRDWPAMQDALRGLPEAAAGLSDKPANEVSLAAVRSVLDPIINGSAEDAPALMIRGWPAVLGYGGMKFTSGDVLAGETEIDSPFSSTPIPAELQVSVTRTGDGKLYFVQTSVVDPEVLRTLTLALIEQIKGRAETRGTARLAEEITAFGITDELGINFDTVSGLPITARIARVTSATMPKGPLVNGEILTIKRIEP
jgi:hypothetical protein